MVTVPGYSTSGAFGALPPNRCAISCPLIFSAALPALARLAGLSRAARLPCVSAWCSAFVFRFSGLAFVLRLVRRFAPCLRSLRSRFPPRPAVFCCLDRLSVWAGLRPLDGFSARQRGVCGILRCLSRHRARCRYYTPGLGPQERDVHSPLIVRVWFCLDRAAKCSEKIRPL